MILLCFTLFLYINYGNTVISALSALLFFVLVILAKSRRRIIEHLFKYWIRLGKLLSKFSNPVVALFSYVLIILPFALISKILRRDELNLKKSNLTSYWVEKKDEPLDIEWLKRQF